MICQQNRNMRTEQVRRTCVCLAEERLEQLIRAVTSTREGMKEAVLSPQGTRLHNYNDRRVGDLPGGWARVWLRSDAPAKCSPRSGQLTGQAPVVKSEIITSMRRAEGRGCWHSHRGSSRLQVRRLLLLLLLLLLLSSFHAATSFHRSIQNSNMCTRLRSGAGLSLMVVD
ncbi:hypothetical protein EYF80_024537 [Liparis tanakae]|uniref:Uncharacterized protein n=1 Tax=Liparis tanakae TaxID=230148 RepID=A0A4Z2HHB4_9TELE|nr:hypothetical protein EYF80_024537 [Liparis tanakae]